MAGCLLCICSVESTASPTLSQQFLESYMCSGHCCAASWLEGLQRQLPPGWEMRKSRWDPDNTDLMKVQVLWICSFGPFRAIDLDGQTKYSKNMFQFWQSTLARSTGKVYYDGSSEFGSLKLSHLRQQCTGVPLQS